MKTLTINKRPGLQPIVTAAPAGTELVPAPKSRVPARLPTELTRVFRPSSPSRQPLRSLPPKRTYTASEARGWISRLGGHHLKLGRPIEIELPPGTPRYVNARTLTRLLGGNEQDRLLKRNGDAWTICDKSLTVDLQDTATEYRVGPVAVYS